MTMPFEEMPEEVQDFIRGLGLDPDTVQYLEITPEQAAGLISQGLDNQDLSLDDGATAITNVLSDRSHQMWHESIDPSVDQIVRYIMAQYAAWVALDPERVFPGMMDHEQEVVREVVEKVHNNIHILIQDTLSNYVEPEFAHLIVNLGNRCGEVAKQAIVGEVGAAMYNIWTEYLADENMPKRASQEEE